MSTLRVNNLKSRTGTAVTITSGHNLDVEGGLNVTGNSLVTGVSTFSGITSFTNGANVTGVVTFSELSIQAGVTTFSGNVEVAGVLTYEDVTNVDSVGVVTAREGIRIGAGKSIGSDGAAVVYYGDGSNLTGAGPTLTNGSNNRVVTATGANALDAESTLEYSGGQLTITANGAGDGLRVVQNGDHHSELRFDNNRSNANNNIAIMEGRWSGTIVSAINFVSGLDTTNKDDGHITFQTRESGQALATAMKIDEKGYVSNLKNPSFCVQKSGGGNYDNNTVILWDTIQHNTGSCYTSGNGRFTAPIAGRYIFACSQLTKNGGSGAMSAFIRKNGANYCYCAHSHHNDWAMEASTAILDLAANDYVDIWKEKDYHYGNYSTFTGALIN